MTRQAIIHVENTEGVVDFAKFLSEFGWTILSANRTEELLKNAKIPVIKEHALVENNLYLIPKKNSNQLQDHLIFMFRQYCEMLL